MEVKPPWEDLVSMCLFLAILSMAASVAGIFMGVKLGGWWLLPGLAMGVLGVVGATIFLVTGMDFYREEKK